MLNETEGDEGTKLARYSSSDDQSPDALTRLNSLSATNDSHQTQTQGIA